MKSELEQKTRALVDAWNRATGQSVQWVLNHEHLCAHWFTLGLTLEDVAIIVRHYRDLRRAQQPAKQERFDRIILDPDTCYYVLQSLRADKRKKETPEQKARERVVAEAGLTKPEPDAVKPIAKVLEQMPNWDLLRNAVKNAPAPETKKPTAREVRRANASANFDGVPQE